MAIYAISASASGPSGTVPTNTVPVPGVDSGIIFLPMKTAVWRVGVACQVNFSGTGVGTGGNAAAGTATVQFSNDPAIRTSPLTARWNNHDTLVNLTTDKNSSIVYPCYAVRLFLTSYGGGTVTLMIGTLDYQLG